MKNKIDYMEIIEAFNEGGKSKAEKLVQEKYGKHYHIVQRNIAKNTGYSYSRHTKKYELINTKEEQFLTLEELCDTPKHSSKIEEYTTRKDTSLDLGIVSDSFKELVLNLMKDRIKELNKYVFFEPSSKIISIYTKKLEKNGYTVMLV